MLNNVREMTKEYLRSVCQGCQILLSVSPKPPHPTTYDKVTVATVKSELVVISGKHFGEHYIWWALYMYLVNRSKKVIWHSTLWQVGDVIIFHVLDIHSAVQIYPVTSSKRYKIDIGRF